VETAVESLVGKSLRTVKECGPSESFAALKTTARNKWLGGGYEVGFERAREGRIVDYTI
jgi:hypothetical protein